MPQTISQKALIREMSADELQTRADELFNNAGCDFLKLTPEEHQELSYCAAQYFQLSGQVLAPKPAYPSFS